MFARLRTDGPQMTSQEIDTLVARYLAAQLDVAEITLATPGQSVDDLEGTEFALQDQIETAEQDLRFNRFTTVRPAALSLLGGATVDEDSDGFRTLCRRLLEAKLQALWAELRARKGEPLRRSNGTDSAPAAEPVPAPAGSPMAPVVAPPATPLLSEGFKTFNATEGSRKRWRPKTLADHLQVQRILLDFLADKPVGTVTKANLLDWYAMVRMIPAKRDQYKGMTIPQIVEATRTLDVPRIADKSINARYLSTAKAFFNYAEKVDWVSKSPALALDPIKLSTAVGDKGFTADELVKVFGGLKDAATKIDRTGYYWVAVLALYSGARLDEVAGLRLEDVRETEGVWCLHINEAGGRSLKNAFSTRTVPIHSRVIELGFLDYFRSQRGPMLVENTAMDKRGKFGTRIGSFFAIYLKAIGVKQSRDKTFHSLRHTWATAARRAGIPDAEADSLGGWARTGSQRSRTYAADQLIPAKSVLIERLHFI